MVPNNNYRHFIDVGRDEIIVQCHFLSGGITNYYRELFHDFFATQYNGQKIRFIANDGEDIWLYGLVDIMDDVCRANNIPHSQVCLETFNSDVDPRFPHKHLELFIFKMTHEYVTKDIPPLIERPAFVGLSIGRFTITRLRLAYEVAQMFPRDNFMIWRPHLNTVLNFFTPINNAYQKELNWLKLQKFKDGQLNWDKPWGELFWIEACKTYHHICNQYKIEIVPETSIFTKTWFTEKTARCIVAKKPFVLISGQHGLQALRDMGFKTFSDYLDESYDKEADPIKRIKLALGSINELRNSMDIHKHLASMDTICEFNKQHYDTIKI